MAPVCFIRSVTFISDRKPEVWWKPFFPFGGGGGGGREEKWLTGEVTDCLFSQEQSKYFWGLGYLELCPFFITPALPMVCKKPVAKWIDGWDGWLKNRLQTATTNQGLDNKSQFEQTAACYDVWMELFCLKGQRVCVPFSKFCTGVSFPSVACGSRDGLCPLFLKNIERVTKLTNTVAIENGYHELLL